MQVVNRKMVVPCSPQISRAGEGSAIQLKTGEILFIYNCFPGQSEDFDFAELRSALLNPDTGQLTNEKVFMPCPDACNQMSACLERLPDGDIGFIFGRKSSAFANEIFFSRSADEARTWSKPISLSAAHPDLAPYWVLNNDRLRVLNNGRLALPVCLYYDGYLPDEPQKQIPSAMVTVYSDDGGTTWQLSELLSSPPPEAALPPHRFCGQAGRDRFEVNRRHPYRMQEPGVELLADGRVLFYCRSMTGYMYQCYSSDNGLHYTPLQAVPDLVSPCAPQSIRRLPGSAKLLCVFNDHRQWSYGEPHWEWRAPLTLATSDDHGKSYQIQGEIEDDSHNYCYTSLTFLDSGKLLLTDYESENLPEKRRNLANLKLQLLDISDLN